MTNNRIKSLNRAIELLEGLQDDIAYAQVNDTLGLSCEQILTKLARIHNLLDRSYPEDERDDGNLYHRELDFGDEASQGSFDFFTETEDFEEPSVGKYE